MLVATAAQAAQPTLYRVSSLTGTALLFPVPNPIHSPINMPSSRVAMVNKIGPAKAAVAFPAGDFTYSDWRKLPNPPTAFGVFYQSENWKIDANAGTVGPNPGAMTFTNVPNGFESLPPLSSTSPQPSVNMVRAKPGPNKFGGTWDLGMFLINNQVFAKVGGGFRAGSNTVRALLGATVTNTDRIVPYHPTVGFVNPQFSSTVCPNSLSSCPWANTTTPFQVEVSGVRWTTGMVTNRATLPPIPMLPPTGTVVGAGFDNRSGPLSSMGSLQLVSGFVTMGRGALSGTALNQWKLTTQFLPEPGSTALLAAGFGMVAFLDIRRRRNRR